MTTVAEPDQGELVLVSKSALVRIASRSTINAWIHSGRLPALKLGGRWFASPEAIRTFLAGEKGAE